MPIIIGTVTSGALPAIPDPSKSVDSLHETVLALKQGFELLAGTRAGGAAQAATSGQVTSVSNQVSTVQSNLETTNSNLTTAQGDIATNTSNIATNTSDIATNTSNIATLTADIAALPAPAMVLLHTLTASNSTSLQDITTLTTAGYTDFEIVLENLIPATNNTILGLQVHSGGSFQSTSYSCVCAFFSSASNTDANTSTTSIRFCTTMPNTVATGGVSGRIRVANPQGTASQKAWFGQFQGNGFGFLVTGLWTGGTGAVDGFQIAAETGNILSGTVKVYGIK